MNNYYLYLTIEGILTLLEVHYDCSGENYITVQEWFDRHGDTPSLTDQQVHQIAYQIRVFESQRPLGVPEQQELAYQFNAVARI